MKYLNSILILFLLSGSLLSCAQSINGIKKNFAYLTIRNAGTFNVDEPAKSSRDTVFLIYIETGKLKPEVMLAWNNKRIYDVAVIEVIEKQVVVGVDRKSGRRIIISPVKGNRLWLLELTESERWIKPPQLVPKHDIIIQGKFGGKKFIKKIVIISEVQLPDAV